MKNKENGKVVPIKQLNLTNIIANLEKNNLLDLFKINQSKLEPSLFFDPWGIHGLFHAKRVLFLVIVLSDLNNLSSKDDINILVNAALYHDIGRTDNGVCYEHGAKSIKKIEDLKLIQLSLEDEKILKYIIKNHCINDSVCIRNVEDYKIENRDRAIKLLKIFKDCDNLDRVRLGDLDTNYLRNKYSLKLVKVAQQLLYKNLPE